MTGVGEIGDAWGGSGLNPSVGSNTKRVDITI